MIRVDYDNGYSEMIRQEFILDNGKYYVQEYVNADFFRYYEL